MIAVSPKPVSLGETPVRCHATPRPRPVPRYHAAIVRQNDAGAPILSDKS